MLYYCYNVIFLRTALIDKRNKINIIVITLVPKIPDHFTAYFTIHTVHAANIFKT
jgi:hypothetical protein